MSTPLRLIDERFWEKAQVGAPDECWPWVAGTDEYGQGRFKMHKRSQRAHRVAFALAIGTIPADEVVSHLCPTPSCVNPSHLVLGQSWPTAPLCSVNECGKPSTGRGLCSAHYSRWLRARPTSEPGQVLQLHGLSEEARFWAYVEISPECWTWLGGRYDSGYGHFERTGAGPRRSVRAHRYAYEHTLGPIPDGLTLDHLCSNRLCVNPDHLEPVTAEENARRGHERRSERGAAN